MDIEKIRLDTPAVKRLLHFNNAGASLPPDVVTTAIIDYLKFEANTGGYEAAKIRTNEIRGFYEAAGKLISSSPENIAFTSSATNSFARALSAISFEPGDCILIANEDYISNQIAFLSLQKRFTVKLVRAKSLHEGGVDIEDMARLMDTHKPRLVSLTHVPTNSGLIQLVEQVGKLCKERDLLYLVDACQSVGQLPVDVNQIHCDFLSATMRKFLRGPRGTGFLYVSDKVLKDGMEPLYIDMRGADWIDSDTYKPRDDAKRFEDWELPYALVAGSRAAIEYALTVGLDNISSRNKMLCNKLKAGLENLGLQLLDIGANQSSILTLALPGKNPDEVVQFLRDRNINTSISSKSSAQIDFHRKGVEWALRISPHYYNTEDEVATLLEAMKSLIQ